MRETSWQFRIDLGYDASGKRKQKTIGGFNTKKEAEESCSNFIAKYNHGEYFEHENIKLCDHLKNWFDLYAKTHVSPVTYDFYSRIVNETIIPNIWYIKLSKLRLLTIQKFLKNVQVGYSASSVKHYYDVLNIALNHAVKWQIINHNPCKSVEPPKSENKKIKVLLHDQINILLDYIKTQSLR